MKSEKKIHATKFIHPTGLAFGLAVGILYTICAVLVALWPQQSIAIVNSWVHVIDLTKIAISPQITVGSFATGLVSIVVFAYAVGVIYAWAYNRCMRHCERWGLI